MTQLDHARLLYRKACQDRAILTHIVGEPEIDDDAVGFHVQQAIEKLLKSALAARGREYPRTHDLRVLIELLGELGEQIPKSCRDIDELTPFATVFRYDDVSLGNTARRKEWLSIVDDLSTIVAELLGE